MSTSITNYGFRHSKSWENIFLQELDNHPMVIVFAWNCFNPLRNIIDFHQDVGVAKWHRKRSHEVNAPYIKRSTIKMGFKGIMFLHVNFPSLWHLSQLLHMVRASLKSVGQQKPDCNTFIAVFWEAKWPPHVLSWQWLRIPCCSCSGTHFRIIWSTQYLNRNGPSQ